MLTLAGVNDENLIELSKQSGAKIALRGDTLTISGIADAVESRGSHRAAHDRYGASSRWSSLRTTFCA